jgi:hypothetical protein
MSQAATIWPEPLAIIARAAPPGVIRGAAPRGDGRRAMHRTRLAALGLALTLGVAGPALAEDDARDRCIAEAARAGLIGADLNPSNANFVPGTDADDNFSGRATTGRDVFCGFGGNDIISILDAGDVFLGGAGDDGVDNVKGGTFNGGPGP